MHYTGVNREPESISASQEWKPDMAEQPIESMTSHIEMPEADPAHLMPTPAHVPSELIRPFPYILGARTKLRPHSFIAAIHEGPEVFWAERAYSGYRGAWVPRTLEHLHTVYNDNVNFRARDFALFAKLLGEDWFLVPAEADPPVHATLRSMVNPVFTPKRMAGLGYDRYFAQGGDWGSIVTSRMAETYSDRVAAPHVNMAPGGPTNPFTPVDGLNEAEATERARLRTSCRAMPATPLSRARARRRWRWR